MENTAFCNGILKFYEQIDENVTDIEKKLINAIAPILWVLQNNSTILFIL